MGSVLGMQISTFGLQMQPQKNRKFHPCVSVVSLHLFVWNPLCSAVVLLPSNAVKQYGNLRKSFIMDLSSSFFLLLSSDLPPASSAYSENLQLWVSISHRPHMSHLPSTRRSCTTRAQPRHGTGPVQRRDGAGGRCHTPCGRQRRVTAAAGGAGRVGDGSGGRRQSR